MQHVNFKFDSAKLLPTAFSSLESAAKTLREQASVRVDINGYTDSSGSVSYNVRLSEKRADAVRDFLVRKGVRAANLATHGFGPANPVANNDTESERAKNRRVEFQIFASVPSG